MAPNFMHASRHREAAEGVRRETVEQMHHDLAAKLAVFDDRPAWEAWLRFASGFHQYSFANSCLIYFANPNATLVAGYQRWRATGHQVRRGEKGIPILAPVTRTVPLEDADGNPIRDQDGRQVSRRQLIGVRVTHVFDASQVDPPPDLRRPQPAMLVGEAPPGLWNSLAELIADQGYTLRRGDCGGANGYTDFVAREVRVRDDVDDAQSVRTLCHEAAHLLTMDADDIASYRNNRCRGILEVIAESTAYMVTQAHCLSADQYTFNYVAGWAVEAAGRGRDPASIDEIIRQTGERVITAAHRILSHTQPATDRDPAPTTEAFAPVVAPPPQTWEDPAALKTPHAEVATSLARPRHPHGLSR